MRRLLFGKGGTALFDSYEIPEHGFSPAQFLVQLVLAPLGGLVLGLIASTFLETLFRAKDSNLLGYIGFSIQGFLLGYKMQKAFPRAIESGGRWVWIPPVLVLLLGMLYDLSLRGGTPIAQSFWPRPGPGGIGMVLITWPAVASCFYSVGVNAASRSPRNSWAPRLRRMIGRSTGNDKQAEPTTATK
jgi:hypothetical protein